MDNMAKEDHEKDETATVTDDDKTIALNWLRGVLTGILEVAPLSPWMKKATHRMIYRLPDWLMAAWATALNIDYMNTSCSYPDIAESLQSESGRATVQRYLEAKDTVPVMNCLHQLVARTVKRHQAGRLPVDKDMVEREALALALSGCVPAGDEFAGSAGIILEGDEPANHILIDYQIALESGQRGKLERIDSALTGGRYGQWIAERMVEIRRWLGLEPPHFRIQYGERTPQWEALWGDLFVGGNYEQ